MKSLSLFLSLAFIVLTTGKIQEPLVTRPSIISRTRLTSERYEQLSDEFVKDGYRLNYLSGYTINDTPHFAAIWEYPPHSTNASQIARLGMTSTEYQTEFDTHVSQGYRLTLVNGYTVNTSDRYVAIWDTSPSPSWVSKHAMTAADLQATFNALILKGYRATHICGYAIGNEAHYAAILEKRTGKLWTAWAGMTKRIFRERNDIFRAHGYRVIDVNGYGVNELDFYAGIWEYDDAGEWIVRYAMTHQDWELESEKNTEEEYKVKILSGYTVNNTDLYAALWVKDES